MLSHAAGSGRAAVDGWLARHHGVITRSRAIELGLTVRQVDHLVASGAWRQAQRGVLVPASSPPTPHQGTLAAVAAGGRGSAASHLSAAWLHRLLDRPPERPWITVPHARRRRLPGVEVHRSHDIPTMLVAGVPVVVPYRTVVDCAGVLGPTAFAHLVDRAVATRTVEIDELLSAVATAPRRPGADRLAEHLGTRGYDGSPAPSVLESSFWRLVQRSGLPLPEREHPVVVEGVTRYLDTAYPNRLLAWEVDGMAYHCSPEQVASDHRRRNGLRRLGWRVEVFTWRDVTGDPDRVLAELRASYLAAAPVPVRR